MIKLIRHNIIVVTAFGIAMGILEAAIVVYLRKIYFPGGFSFPLVFPEDSMIIVTELVREFCTLVMLLAVAWISGKTFLQRFGWFLYTFAVWDIFYYAGLKGFLDWPASLLTWDILFLIPVTWVGPVLAPVLSSLAMIVLALAFFSADNRNREIKRIEWLMIYGGAFLIFLTFIQDFTLLMIRNDLLGEFFNLANSKAYRDLISTYIPEDFNWILFSAGLGIVGLAIVKIFRR